MPASKKDRVFEAATRLVKQWRQMMLAYTPLKPDNLPVAGVILAAVAGPLDEMSDLIPLPGEVDEPERSRWEYQCIAQPHQVNMNECLRKLGDDGWELCGINYGCFILKRPR